MAQELDAVLQYGLALGWQLRPRTVIVEGTTDAELFHMAAQLESQATGVDLLGDQMTIVAAGERDLGGTRGVIRELFCLRGLARTCLLPNGRPRYRFIGLFDNDRAGKQAVSAARSFDSSILEYKDVFRIHPAMPTTGNLDPKTLQHSFERQNAEFKGLDWELEDLLPEQLFAAFTDEQRSAVIRTANIGGKTHRELTFDGKARLHRFVKLHAIRDDLVAVVETMRALRFYLGLQPAIENSTDRLQGT